MKKKDIIEQEFINSKAEENLMPCCNNLFPNKDDESVMHSIIYCDGGNDEEVTGWNCGTYWSHLVLLTNDDLDYKACNDKPTTINPVNSLTGENFKGKPRLSWSFVYGHGYVIKKKISTGQCNTVDEITNRNTLVWRDSNQSLPPSEKIYYRVYTKLFYSITDSAPEVFFNTPS